MERPGAPQRREGLTLIITIDGPAGSGKSTTARAVARRLGYVHMDSGSLYRAFAFAAGELSLVNPVGEVVGDDVARLARAEVGAVVSEGRMVPMFAGRALDEELRTAGATACASRISAFPQIRERVNALLRHLVGEHLAVARDGGVVCEGRDMGTVVFPEAQLKIYMKAVLEERACRRILQSGDEPTKELLRTEVARLVARDTADSERAASPLRVAEGALVIDTTHLSFEKQVSRILAAAQRKLDTA